MREKAQAT